MLSSLSLVALTLLNAGVGLGASDSSSLAGTWSSKSNQVFTGPGFYDPVDELLIEPSLPGLSYSFTEDGYFEQATYQVTANPKNPACPTAVLTFQHGQYQLLDNGTLILNPITVDGRQLVSDPCNDKGVSSYNRYNQTETFKSFYVQIDDYHGIWKLQLYSFDGSLVQPLYLAYRPPLMLPTATLNPTTEASGAQSTATANQKRSLRQLVRRSLENKQRTNAVKKAPNGILNSDVFWYLSAGMIGIGSLIFLSS